MSTTVKLCQPTTVAGEDTVANISPDPVAATPQVDNQHTNTVCERNDERHTMQPHWDTIGPTDVLVSGHEFLDNRCVLALHVWQVHLQLRYAHTP